MSRNYERVFEITVNAPTSQEYTIAFNLNGGSYIVPSKKTVDGKLSEIPTTTRTGYILLGWYLNMSCEGDPITTDTVFIEDTIVYAKWELDEDYEPPVIDPDADTAISVEMLEYTGMTVIGDGDIDNNGDVSFVRFTRTTGTDTDLDVSISTGSTDFAAKFGSIEIPITSPKLIASSRGTVSIQFELVTRFPASTQCILLKTNSNAFIEVSEHVE